MKLLTTLRAVLVTCLVAASSIGLAAPIPATPTLIIKSGILMGANNVSVNGTLYNVKFADGSCNALFKGCVQSAFAFSTVATATAAANALLNTVFLDGPLGNFDTVGNTTFGCSNSSVCISYIPYSTVGPDFYTVYSANYYGANNVNDKPISSFGSNATNSSQNGSINFAIFQLADANAVPEPSSIALFGLAFAGITAFRRRKS